MRALCRLNDVPDGQARGFPAPAGGFVGLLLVRQGGVAHVYVNACPHIGVPLNQEPDRFLDRDGAAIVCSTHGALFRVADGECIHGPCFGDFLEKVKTTQEDGMIYVPDDAGL